MVKAPAATKRRASRKASAARPQARPTLTIPEPERRERRSKAILLKLTEEENALLARVAASRGEPLATAARVLALAAAQAALA